MRRRLACLAVCAALVTGFAAVSAGASPAQRRPPGSPDLAAMALAVADLPAGARVVRQGYRRQPEYVASYGRELSLGGTRLGRSRVAFVFTELSVARTLARAKTTFASFRALVRSRRSADGLRNEIAREADVDPRTIAVGRPRTPRIGDGTISFPITLTDDADSLRMGITLFRVDRVLGSIVVVGVPGRRILNGDVDRLTRVAGERARSGLVPAAGAPPVVTGSPVPGAALSATSGVWSGDALAFAYQWERCTGDAPAGCSPIPGATAPTYTVSVADLTSLLRVSVSGSNRLGSATATSAATALASGPPGSPTPIAAPLIEGVVGPGATLAATAGTWTGGPTSLAYQWRRCNATSGACVDVPGATAATYALTSADSGSRLRVLVVAANASGPGGALTAPTAAVP